MKISLKTRIAAFIAVVVVLVDLVGVLLFTTAQMRSIEREVVGRGIALAGALARSVDEGLAAENLNLIKQVEDIVHTKDVVLCQVFSTLWQGVASVPPDQLNIPPSPEAVEYFQETKGERAGYHKNAGPWIDIYSPVFFDPRDVGIRKILIGYVRLRISTAQVHATIKEAVLINIAVVVLISLLAIVALNASIGTYVIRPLLALHHSVAQHKRGESPEAVPLHGADEIRELSAEFNQMSVAIREREERLAEEKERLAVTLRSIGDGVIVTDLQGTITLFNRAAEQQTGRTAAEAVGRPLGEVFLIVDDKTREPHESLADQVLRSGQIVGPTGRALLLRRDGGELIIEDGAAPIRDRSSGMVGVVLVFRDVTERRRMEEELLNAEKLRSVGLLAGGLAHDFNNLLTGIVGNISLAKMYLDRGSKAFERLTEAEAASRRATELTYKLLTFSKGGAPIRQTASIADLVREAAGFILSGTNIAAEFDIPGDVWSVDVDTGQMSQVFNNLLINAVQAMPNGGKIGIALGNCVLAADEIPTLKEGTYVRIVVKDEGAGIPTEYLPRIFDPYFTTKQQGSGLGLASVYSIVTRHDGHIAVESRPGQGTTFTLHLPAARKAAPAGAPEDAGVTAGQGSVLVMDDEQIVLDIAREMLSALGYEVACARNGVEVVEMYRRSREGRRPYDVVIMDLTIPGGMGGKEAIARLLALDPEAKVIVSSGYSNDPIMADYRRYGFKGVVPKPYNLRNFSKTLDAVLKG